MSIKGVSLIIIGIVGEAGVGKPADLEELVTDEMDAAKPVIAETRTEEDLMWEKSRAEKGLRGPYMAKGTVIVEEPARRKPKAGARPRGLYMRK